MPLEGNISTHFGLNLFDLSHAQCQYSRPEIPKDSYLIHSRRHFGRLVMVLPVKTVVINTVIAI